MTKKRSFGKYRKKLKILEGTRPLHAHRIESNGKAKNIFNNYGIVLDDFHRLSHQTGTIIPTLFRMHHLDVELKDMSPRKVGGADEVQIFFLQHTPRVGKKLLLDTVNRTYFQSMSPAQCILSCLIRISKLAVKRKFPPISLTWLVARSAKGLIKRIFMK